MPSGAPSSSTSCNAASSGCSKPMGGSPGRARRRRYRRPVRSAPPPSAGPTPWWRWPVAPGPPVSGPAAPAADQRAGRLRRVRQGVRTRIRHGGSPVRRSSRCSAKPTSNASCSTGPPGSSTSVSASASSPAPSAAPSKSATGTASTRPAATCPPSSATSTTSRPTPTAASPSRPTDAACAPSTTANASADPEPEPDHPTARGQFGSAPSPASRVKRSAGVRAA